MREQRPSRTRRSAISVIGVLLVGMLAVVAIGPGAALAQREETIYRIDTGDKLSVRVFNEPDLSGEFVVDDQGQVSLPLIGNVEFQGRSVREALSNLADRLSHQLAGETDPVRIHLVLTQEHRASLMELCDE